MVRTYEKESKEFVNAIKDLAAKPDSLDNLERYLTYHFSAWLEKYANTPENITSELQHFANI